MTTQTLKGILDAAVAAHDSERDRLMAAGVRSADRYQRLRSLKAAVDAANRAYVQAAHTRVRHALNAIIEADRPVRAEAARARSGWKQHKHDLAMRAGR